jgi:hypothetical protein
VFGLAVARDFDLISTRSIQPNVALPTEGSGTRTQDLWGWKQRQPELLADIGHPSYFAA